MGKTLGDFEQLVLLAALRLGPKAYAVTIGDEIERRTSRTFTHGAVYVALQRLERRGLVRSHMGQATPERGGKPKRYYRVVPRAVPLLVEKRAELHAMWQDLDIAKAP